MARNVLIAGREYPVRFTLRDVLVSCDKHGISVEEIGQELGNVMTLKSYDFLLDIASLGLTRGSASVEGHKTFTPEEVDELLTSDISAISGIVEGLMDSLTCGAVFPTAPSPTDKGAKQIKTAK